MTLQQIRYILGVAEAGSLNKASEKLFISQPNILASTVGISFVPKYSKELFSIALSL